MKHHIKDLATTIRNSFLLCWKGSETIHNVIWKWGAIPAILNFLIIERSMRNIHLNFINVIISFAVIAYFVWHIIVIRKCSPKKPKPTKEEIEQMKLEKKKKMLHSFMRKLFLKEAIINHDPAFVMIVIDILIITNHVGFLTK